MALLQEDFDQAGGLKLELQSLDVAAMQVGDAFA